MVFLCELEEVLSVGGPGEGLAAGDVVVLAYEAPQVGNFLQAGHPPALAVL